MPLALNSTDPLASSLTYLIGVDDDNAIKFFKGSLTATPGANVTLQNGAYGRAFRTGAARSAESLVTWPVQQLSNVTPITVFVAYNQFNSASVISTGISSLMFSGRLDGTAGALLTGMQMDIGNGQWMPSMSTTGVSQSAQDASNTTADMRAAGAHSIAWRTNGIQAASVAAFLDGVLDSHFNPARTNAGSLYGGGSATANWQGVGGNVVGATAQSALSLDYVYIAVWVGATVPDSEIARLHASLNGSNAFALVAEAGVPPAVTTQPTAQTVTAPATATFNYAFSNATSVQAQRRANSGAAWVDVAGATLTSYTTPATTTGDAGAEYRFGATGAGGPIYTNTVALTVNAQPGALTITSSTPSLTSAFSFAQPPGVVTFGPLKNGSGFTWTGSDMSVFVYNRSTGALVQTFTNVAYGASGGFVSSSNLAAGSPYRVSFRIPASASLPNGAKGEADLTGS